MSELHQQVQKLAFSDELTNLANVNYFHDYLSREWRRLLREQKPLSLILFDIDYFKAYNDNYGHLSGDFCLQAIAEIVGGASKRAADLAARFGDDQLAIILPNTDIKGAVNVAKIVRSHLKKSKIPHLSSPVAQYLTLSVGVVTMVPKLPSTPDKLVNTAIRSLAQAKKQGRDRIVIANW